MQDIRRARGSGISNTTNKIQDVPNTPTGVAVTEGGVAGKASVTFTPATTGGAASLYTATSSPGSITGTSTASPISVSGLTQGTAYTFTVTPQNGTATGTASSASSSFTSSVEGLEYIVSASTSMPSAASSVTLTIPTGYTHLQLRVYAQTTRATYNYDGLRFRFNGDTASNYYYEYMTGDTAAAGTAFSTSYTSGTSFRADLLGTTTKSSTFNQWGFVIIDIPNYLSGLNKTWKAYGGTDSNGASGGYVSYTSLYSGYWSGTAAITSITLFSDAGANFSQYSCFDVYGIKA